MFHKDLEEQFLNRLTELRIDKGVSARDMSLSIGQNAAYINKIENKRNLPSMTVFFYICEYFNITPNEFFELEINRPLEKGEVNSLMDKLDDEEIELFINLLRRFVKNKED